MTISTLGITIKSVLDNSTTTNDNMYGTIVPEIPTCNLHQPKDVSEISKKHTQPSLFIQKLDEIKHKHNI